MADMDSDALWLRVTQREPLTEHIIAYELQHPEGLSLPPFEAGAHLNIDVPDGSGRKRAYSLCNDPIERHRYQIAIQREEEGRGASAWLTEHLQPGDLIRATQPRQLFNWQPATHSILIAGGIGLTPLISMADMLWRQGHAFELHCAIRDISRLPFSQRLHAAPWRQHLHLHIDSEPARYQGRLDVQRTLMQAPAGSKVFTCGPAGLMDAVVGTAQQLSWPTEHIVMERFTPPPDHTAAHATDFEVLWAPTGQRISVAPEQSTAEALIQAGIPVDLSCEQGICGQCCLQVLDGTPEHQDLILTESERGTGRRFTPCCSRASSARLTLAPVNWMPDAPTQQVGSTHPAQTGLPTTTWRQA